MTSHIPKRRRWTCLLPLNPIGTEWEQPPRRPPRKAIPYYHYLQTEKGCGRIATSRAELSPSTRMKGLLLAPHIRHSYEKESSRLVPQSSPPSPARWRAASRPSSAAAPPVRIDREQGRQLARPHRGSARALCAAKHRRQKELLSVSCYRLLLEFAGGSHAHGLTDDPLYQNYVAPCDKRNRKKIRRPADRGRIKQPGLHHAPVSVPALPEIHELLHRGVSDLLPHQQGQGTADHGAPDRDPGRGAPHRLHRRQPFHRDLPQDPRGITPAEFRRQN